VSTGVPLEIGLAAPQRIPRRAAPARPRPDARPRHLQLVDTARRRREQRRRWVVRVWAAGIVVAALVGVMVHAFMAEGQLRADQLAQRIEREQTRYADARLALAQSEAPRLIIEHAARLGLVPGSGTLTVAVPGVSPEPSTAPKSATKSLQAVQQVMDGSP
jgi:hypothetical protein